MEDLARAVALLLGVMFFASLLALPLSGRDGWVARLFSILFILLGFTLGMNLLLSVSSLGARVIGSVVLLLNFWSAWRVLATWRRSTR